MKLNKFIITTTFLLLGHALLAQWQQEGLFINVGTTAHIQMNGDLRVKSGTFRNSGSIYCRDLIVQSTGTLDGLGVGMWQIRSNFQNAGSVTSSGTFSFYSSSASSILSNGAVLRIVALNKVGSASLVSLADPLTISTKVSLSGTSKLLLGPYNLILQNTANITGATDSRFVVTDNTGMIIKQGLGTTAFTYPVGATTTTYNRLIVSNSGTTDDIGVRCLPEALSAGGTGVPISTDAVGASWEVSEAITGGSNLNLTTYWLTADEKPSFSRTACAVRHWGGTAWDSAPLGASTGAGTMANPWKRSRNGLSNMGYFAVLDGAFLLNALEDRFEPDQVGNAQLMLSPNPTALFLNIHASLPQNTEATRLRIFSSVGTLIIDNKQIDINAPINVSALDSGWYWLEITTSDGKVLSAKFIKSSER